MLIFQIIHHTHGIGCLECTILGQFPLRQAPVSITTSVKQVSNGSFASHLLTLRNALKKCISRNAVHCVRVLIHVLNLWWIATFVIGCTVISAHLFNFIVYGLFAGGITKLLSWRAALSAEGRIRHVFIPTLGAIFICQQMLDGSLQ